MTPDNYVIACRERTDDLLKQYTRRCGHLPSFDNLEEGNMLDNIVAGMIIESMHIYASELPEQQRPNLEVASLIDDTATRALFSALYYDVGEDDVQRRIRQNDELIESIVTDVWPIDDAFTGGQHQVQQCREHAVSHLDYAINKTKNIAFIMFLRDQDNDTQR